MDAMNHILRGIAVGGPPCKLGRCNMHALLLPERHLHSVTREPSHDIASVTALA